MAFWSRLKQSKLKFIQFSNEFKRCYTLNHGPIFTNQHIPSRTLASSLINPNYVVSSSQLELFCKVRSFAAPFQANQKKEEKDTSGPRLNEQITAPTIRLVIDDDHHFITSKYEALARAKSLKLDLVEVDRLAKPPVCKIVDYHRLRYIQKTRKKELAKTKTTVKKGPCKEVRFAAKIKQKDLEIKANMVKRLMESGYRVKCTAIEPTDELDMETLLSRFRALIEEVAFVESGPKVEKKQAYFIVRHIKFGPSKKGQGKKASKSESSSETGSENQPSEDNGDTTETEHADSDELSDEDVQTNKSKWAVFDGDEDIHTVLDISDEKNWPKESSKHEQPPIVTQPLGLPKQTTENRYARDPRSRVPTDTNGRGPRNTMNPVPRFPTQGNHPQFSMNRLPQTRTNQQDQVPAHQAPKQDSNSPTKSYGIFSAQQVNTMPREQSAPAENNRYKRNPPMNRGPNVDNPGQAKRGIFSTDNSNMIPNRTNESESEFQRR